MSVVFKVCIPHTHLDYFDYQAETIIPCIGARVWVSFRTKTRLGVVVGQGAPQSPAVGLKSILEVLDNEALIPNDLLDLCNWVSRYYQSSLSEVIPLVLPKKYRLGVPSQVPLQEGYALSVSLNDVEAQSTIKARKQRELIEFISNTPTGVASKKELLQAGFRSPQWKTLCSLGILTVQTTIDVPMAAQSRIDTPLILNEEQSFAVEFVSESLQAYRCFLLQGVTGSGKTEVYLHLITRVLAMGRQVLVLVPEIGLTPQLLARFRARFSVPMAVIHSDLNDSARQAAWQLARDHHVSLIIGTRSAVWTPMRALGLVIVDEEHDASFKQMDGVRYHARDVALMRAHAANIPILLGSATPSLETIHNVTLNKYTRLRLQKKAMDSPPLYYQLVDVRHQTLTQGIAPITLRIIRDHLQQNNQVLVFINRRGFAPVLMCHQCGWMADCRACASHLTVHRSILRLVCHHCGFTDAIQQHCPTCNGHELQPVGVGTQRVYDYLSTQFPNTDMLRIDKDEVSRKQAFEACLAKIDSGEVQLIVGTQMLAKGHHFPKLTLVVVLDADNGFYNQDFRALEGLGQLLIQVVGRAGRAEFPGHAIIQTHFPDNPLLNRLIQKGYDDFSEALLSSRQKALLPPYAFIALIRAESSNQDQVSQFLLAVKARLQTNQVLVLGPAPAPLSRKAGQHRMQLFIKSHSRAVRTRVLSELRVYLLSTRAFSRVRWSIDVDPIALS